MPKVRPILFVALLPLALAGCISTNQQSAFNDVGNMVKRRTGQNLLWLGSDGADGEIAKEVAGLMQKELTDESAVAIALLNNRSLQAEFEEIGISQADLAQASRLHNPNFAASWRFPDRPPSAVDAEYSVAGNFLDLLILPARKNMAAQNLEETKLRVANEVLNLAHETRTGFYTLQAHQQLVARWQVVVDANAAAADFAKRQHDAGNINDLTWHDQQTAYTQTRLELTQAQAQVLADRERLNRLLGLAGGQTDWKTNGELPALPEAELPLDNLESLAVNQRLDLAEARAETQSMADALALKTNTRWLPGVAIGVDTERQSDGQRITGPTLDLELPIFDQGQPAIAKLAAQFRQSQRRYEALEVNVRSEVRDAVNALRAARETAELYQQDLLPQRQQILRETLLQYNAMQMSSYELLAAKEREQTAERGYIEALRDYWIARAELERAVGGRFIASVAPLAPVKSESGDKTP